MKKLAVSALMALVLALMALAAAAQTDGDARVRFVHVIPGASSIDIYTDGELTVSALGIGQASPYITLAAGRHAVTVTQSGITTPLWQQTITLNEGSAVTLV